MNALLSAPERTITSNPVALPSTASVLGQAAHENFPVALRLLPRAVRDHLVAVYGFARLADDIGDEAEGDRMELLDWLAAELDRASRGVATHPLLVRLTPTIRQFDLPLDPFQRLIEANRRDQVVQRYRDVRRSDRLLHALSRTGGGARVADFRGELSRSDRALRRGVQRPANRRAPSGRRRGRRRRSGVPAPERPRALGCTEAELRAPRTSPALRAVLRYEAGRARRLLASAVPLARQLPLQPRIAVCGFAAGGLAALDAIERAGYEVLAPPLPAPAAPPRSAPGPERPGGLDGKRPDEHRDRLPGLRGDHPP